MHNSLKFEVGDRAVDRSDRLKSSLLQTGQARALDSNHDLSGANLNAVAKVIEASFSIGSRSGEKERAGWMVGEVPYEGSFGVIALLR